jgi:hypothetical protein
MKPKILLVNPPIYDFTAYDFWLKPYGMLSVAGMLRGQADFKLFDFLDRNHPFIKTRVKPKEKSWNIGSFYSVQIPKPLPLKNIPRRYNRIGLPRQLFIDFLNSAEDFDFVFISTTMTYWYQGIMEVMEDIRAIKPAAKIILGGNYVTICPTHAAKLNADLLVSGSKLEPLWQFLNLIPKENVPALWEVYDKLSAGVLKLTDGCPFKCTYCSVPIVHGGFSARPLSRALDELKLLVKMNISDIAFYDDALLFDSEKILVPFLEEVLKLDIKVNFHTPNALNARFITKQLAELMLRAGFKTFYIGFESFSRQWQQTTGAKVFNDEFAQAVEHLLSAGAEPQNITGYQIIGHPKNDNQELEESMRFVNNLGIRGTLADFSPIPGTPDGQYCQKWIDLDEPLMHNKTAFPIILLGSKEVDRLKDLQRALNRSIMT